MVGDKSEGREGHEPKHQQVAAPAPSLSALLYRGAFRTRDFRQRLLEDSKGTEEQELGSRLPEGVEVRVVQESARTIYLVLPSGLAYRRRRRTLRSGARGGGRWRGHHCGLVRLCQLSLLPPLLAWQGRK